MALTYTLIKAFVIYAINLFFREVVIINEDSIPQQGATIVYGNHNNQFVDAMLLIKSIPRIVHFLAAAKSMKRWVLGTLIKMSCAIPVERAVDLAKQGPGLIVEIKNQICRGNKTKFTQLQVGSSIQIQNIGQLKIKKINSNQQIVTEKSIQYVFTKPLKYKIIPKVEYSQLYENVWSCLKDGKCIGIFPEGGSHDRLELLPLKAGICIMALGAMEKYNIPVTLVSCGFNYYNPQNFRSKVILEFGIPYKIKKQTLQMYKINKKQAISQLLNQIQNNLKQVTTSIKSFNQLSTLFTCRSLYALSADKVLTQKQKLQLNRKFSKGYQMLSQAKNQKAIKLFKQVIIANIPILSKQLKKRTILQDLFTFTFYFYKAINRLIFALPGLLLMGPTTTIIAYLSQKQRIKCLKSSKVKVKGNDVVGSYKILLSLLLFPFTNILNSFIIYKLLDYYTELEDSACFKIVLLVYFLLPFFLTFMVRSYDSMFRTINKLKFYITRLFKRDIYIDIMKKRKHLSVHIRQLVDQCGKQLFKDFEKHRIISRKDFKNQSQSSPQKNKLIE